MTFSVFSRMLVSCAFLSVFSCGVVIAQESEVASESEVKENSKTPIAEEIKETSDNTNVGNDVKCENMGSFTVNSTVSTSSAHFGLFKNSDGLYIKDINDDNKDDQNKVVDSKSYSVSYDCYMCYNPADGNKQDEESKSTESAPVESSSEGSETLKK